MSDEQSSEGPAEEPAGARTEPAPENKPKRFPTAFTVLAIVLLVVWLASFVIPAGQYETDPKTGGPVPGSYSELPSCDSTGDKQPCSDKSLLHQFSNLWASPTDGLYGIENGKGLVSVDNAGYLYGSAQIFLFVLAIGAFISVTMKTGAIQRGIGRLALRFKDRPAALIIVIMLVFAIGGTTEGMWEETLGFFALLVPLALALGFDRMTGARDDLLRSRYRCARIDREPVRHRCCLRCRRDRASAMASACDWRCGSSSSRWRIVYVLRYAFRVRADNTKSVMGLEGMQSGGLRMADEAVGDVEPLTSRQKVILTLFFAAFAVMIYGFIPWPDIWDTIFGADFPLPVFDSFYFAAGNGAVPRGGRGDRPDRPARREGDSRCDHPRRRRVPRRGLDHRPRPRGHGGDEERVHHRHDPALDRERGHGPRAAGSSPRWRSS